MVGGPGAALHYRHCTLSTNVPLSIYLSIYLSIELFAVCDNIQGEPLAPDVGRS